MDTIEFKLATECNLEEIISLFQDAVALQEKQGIRQWGSVYPPRKILVDDISRGQLYIGWVDGIIASVFVMNKDCDEQYENGSWRYEGDHWSVLHRLCVNASLQNQGIGTKTLKYIEEKVSEEGIESIRLEAFSENPYSLALYQKQGFQVVGETKRRTGLFYLMEKVF